MAAETPAGLSPASDFLMYKFSRSGLSGPSTEKQASGYDVATVWAKGVFPLPSEPYSRIAAGKQCGTGSENGRGFQMKNRSQRWTGRIHVNGVLMQLTIRKNMQECGVTTTTDDSHGQVLDLVTDHHDHGTNLPRHRVC